MAAVSHRRKPLILDFCADRGITCDIELIGIDQINDAYERMLKSDVKYLVRDRHGKTK